MSLQDAFRHAITQHQAGNLAQAEAIYRQILAAVPAHADSWHLLGVVTHQHGQSRQAIKLIREAIRLAPQAADYYANLGEAYRALEEFGQAIEAFEEALQRKPEHISAMNNLAIALTGLRRFDEAIAWCERALAIKPDYANAVNTLAAAWQLQGEFDKAIPLFRRAMALLPNVPELACGLAECLLASDEPAAALAEYAKVLAHLPARRGAQQGYAQALLDLQRVEEASAYLATLPEIGFEEDSALGTVRAKVLRAQGDLQAALTELHVCVRRNAGYIPGRNELVDLLAELARRGKLPPLDYPTPSRVPSISIIVCSITPAKFTAVTARYKQLFAKYDIEIIGIHDAKSLAEGYNRGAAQSRGEVLIFSHDDIEILNDDFALRLFSHISQFDLVGVAGTRKLIDPAWRKSGFPHLAGLVAHKRPEDDDYLVCVFGLHEGTATGIEAVDGLWFAARRAVWETVRFDADTFDGFHLYDMDFSFAAHLAGFRLAVASDLLMVHHSHGDYGADWEAHADRFRQKHARELADNQALAKPFDYLPVRHFASKDEVALFAGLARSYLPTGNHLLSTNDYALWLKRYATLSPTARAEQRHAAANFAQQPLVSVLMPVYNAPERWLRVALDSVLAQTYERWELCIADDASPEPHVRAVLQEYAARDRRIRVVFRTENGHISAASNSALALVTGEWLVLLDHDDELAPDALFRVVERLNQYPNAGVIYSDEDKINENGVRSQPYFKPDWNYDLFLSHNLISHLGAYRTSLVRDVGGFRLGLEGSQDYDLALRVIEKLEASQIHHLPYLLYHWRTLEESTASGAEAKPYAYINARRAISEHLARRGVAGEVLPSPDYAPFNRVVYHLPATPPRVSIIIPTRNGLSFLSKCIASLEKTDYPDYEVLIVDNGSDDEAALAYLQNLAQRPGYQILRDATPFNFAALNNKAAAQASGDVFCLLNNDTEVIHADWLREMVSIALQPCVGAVGARLWYGDYTLQHAGVLLGMGGVAGHAHHGLARGQFGYLGRAILAQSLSAVTAACLVIRKDRFNAIGGMNEALAVAFNDVDFCLRLCAAGYRNVWTPFAELFHYESKTRGYEDSPQKRERFGIEATYMMSQWGDLLSNDPAYNPNLSLAQEGYGLAWPPRHWDNALG